MRPSSHITAPLVAGSPVSCVRLRGAKGLDRVGSPGGGVTRIDATPVADHRGARQAAITPTAPDSVHGVVLDSIVPSAASEPRPPAWAPMPAGVAGLACMARQRGTLAA